MTLSDRTLLGRAGERVARAHLERNGLVFVEANWRRRGGEIDLVMRDGECLVFVEVKTRHGEAIGRAEESVTEAQGRRILAVAERYLVEHPDLASLTWRVDLVAVTLDRRGAVMRLTHWQDAAVTG